MNSRGLSEEMSYDILRRVTGVLPATLKHHKHEHEEFLKMSAEQQCSTFRKVPGRKSLISESVSDALKNFISSHYSTQHPVNFEAIHQEAERLVRGEIGTDALHKHITQVLHFKAVTGIPEEAQRLQVTDQQIEMYFQQLQVINGAPSSLVLNLDESGQQDWVDKRREKVYIPSSDSAKFVRFPVSRAGQ